MSQVNGSRAPSYSAPVSDVNSAATSDAGTPMSAADLELWLKQRVNKMWSNVAAATSGVEQNGKVLDALRNANTAATADPPNPEEVANQLKAARDAIPDTPENKERRELLDAEINKIQPSNPQAVKEKREAATQAFYASRSEDKSDMNIDAYRSNLQKTGKFTKAEIDQLVAEAQKSNNMKDGGNGDADRDSLTNWMTGFINDKMFPEGGRFDKDAVKEFIKGQSSSIEGEDRLAMIKLQQAMSDAQEAIQTVSNIKKNASEAQLAVIRNFV